MRSYEGWNKFELTRRRDFYNDIEVVVHGVPGKNR